jgi:aldehyde:ferredoxin oxidoreductase
VLWGVDVDPLKTEGQVELSRNLRIATAFLDSSGISLFIAFAIMDQPETFQALIDMMNSFCGLNITGDNIVSLGKRVLPVERDFNKRASFTSRHDRLPPFLLPRDGSSTQHHFQHHGRGTRPGI